MVEQLVGTQVFAPQASAHAVEIILRLRTVVDDGRSGIRLIETYYMLLVVFQTHQNLMKSPLLVKYWRKV